jgi:hypothetical protein
MLILLSILVIEGKFDNNINNNILFKKNLKTSSKYSNNQLAIN